MPEICVNGVTLAYEVHGRGPSVVWNTHGWFSRDNLAYLVAGRLAAHYRVLIWDRRNCGASDLAMEDTPSEHDLWIEDLHGLLKALDLSPAYLAGACNGAALSLQMARRYPADVRGLLLVAPPFHYTEGAGDAAHIVAGQFYRPAQVAEEKGMAAVIAESAEAWVRMGSAGPEPGDRFLRWIAETISMNPCNCDRLLAMDPKAFASIMRKWARWYAQGAGHIHGVSYGYIRPITLPALVAHGFDPIHPRDTAEELYRVLPNAEWVEYSDRYTQEEMEQANHSWGLALPFMEEFLDRLEAR